MPNIPTDSATATTITRSGDTLISFGGCNYLALAHHTSVAKAVAGQIPIVGLSTSASRETTGNAAPHAQLESALRDFCCHPSALLVPDGYIANLAAFQGLAALGVTHAVLDERAHASIVDAATLASMTIHRFEHLDAVDAATIITKIPARAVIATDAVFTTDGVLAPIIGLSKALRRDDYLVLDDCHGLGVLGQQGQGTANELGLSSPQLLVTSTLAKGLGCAGGVIMGNAGVVESARSNATSYICTTPASPALAAGALASLKLLQSDPSIRSKLKANTQRVHTILQSHQINTPNIDTPIFAFTIGDETNMRRIENQLLREGVLVPLMQYPNGPAPIYFRLVVNAMHSQAQLDHLDQALHRVLTLEGAS